MTPRLSGATFGTLAAFGGAALKTPPRLPAQPVSERAMTPPRRPRPSALRWFMPCLTIFCRAFLP
jgi:hypothetical protein